MRLARNQSQWIIPSQLRGSLVTRDNRVFASWSGRGRRSIANYSSTPSSALSLSLSLSPHLQTFRKQSSSDRINSKSHACVDLISLGNRSYSQTATYSDFDSPPLATPTPSPSSLTSIAASTANLFNPNHAWSKRVMESAHQLSKVNSRPTRVTIVGTSHSHTPRLAEALLDEPLSYAPTRARTEQSQRETAAAENATNISLIQDRRQIAASLASKARSDPSVGNESDLDLTESLRIQDAPSAHLGFPNTSDPSDSFRLTPTLGLPLPWLREGNGIELVELLDPTSSPSESLLSTLYSSDLIFFHISASNLYSASRADPVLSLLSRFAEKPGTRLLVDDSTGDSSSSDVETALEKVIGTGTLEALKNQIRFTSPKKSSLSDTASSLISTRLALRANRSMRTALEIDDQSNNSSSSTAAAWESFRSSHMASNFPSIRALMSPSSLPSPAVSASHSLTFVLRQALSSAASQVSSAREEVEYAKGASKALREVAKDEMESKEIEVLQGAKRWAGKNSNHSVSSAKETKVSRFSFPGLDAILGRNKDVETRAGDLPSGSMSIGETTEPQLADSAPLASSAGVISATLGNRLAWWKVAGLGRVDDVRTEVEGAVVAGWGRKAEEWLIFEAGRILSSAQSQSQKTTSILDSISKNTRSSPSLRNLSNPTFESGSSSSVFSSSLLRNSIEAHSPSRLQMFSSPLLLSSPIAQRRSQLLSPGGPLDALVKGGQKAVFQSWLIAGSGLGISLLGAGTGAGLRLGLVEYLPGFTLSSIAMSPSTSFALALFSVVLAAWRMQGLWTKSKKKFWRSWEGVANGLEEDVKVQLRKVLEDGVYITPIKAAEGIEGLVKKREDRIRSVEDEVRRVIRDAREVGILNNDHESRVKTMRM